MTEVYGNTTGLSPSALRTLERIYRRRVPLDRIATPELLRSLAEASRETKRQVGALVHRSGQVDYVVVGHATGLMLPDIGRLRAAEGRFRALRLVHTHLFNEPLTRDDLVDLTRLRLDLVAAVLLGPDGEPVRQTFAYNVPISTAGETPYAVVGPEPYGHALPNFGELITSLEAEFARKARTREVRAKDGQAILIHVGDKKRPGAMGRAKSRLDELGSLAETAGVEVVDRVIQLRDALDPKFVLGSGKLDDVVMRAIDLDVETLIFDCDLSPAQAHGIASKTDLKVVDRTQLILDIFAQRAESSDGKLQVELAQLKYTLPRLSQKDDALSRLTGGIGGRGPGETKLEIGRRRARDAYPSTGARARDAFPATPRASPQASRERPTARRHRRLHQRGKSTLLNTLTNAGVLAEDKLFATLDPRARRLFLADGREAILTDTVGFVRAMPKDLFAAFRSTFEEATHADLLLEVVDVSDPEYDEHLETTEKVIEELGLGGRPRLCVYNKVDRLTEEARQELVARGNGVPLSALSRASCHELVQRITALLPAPRASSEFGPSESLLEEPAE